MTEYTHGTKDTVAWFKQARPKPTEKEITTQIGVHLEEFAEFLDVINPTNYETVDLLERALVAVNDLAEHVKNKGGVEINQFDRVNALDALCDGIVTAVGVAHHYGMDILAGLNEVNRSNFSKFDSNGTPVIDSNRKIIKGPNYTKPDLSQMV